MDSVLQQKYNDYEIILIDDGSTDTSGQICDQYVSEYKNVIQVIHKKNEGLFLARQDGFALAKGDYCICLDSDDFLTENSLRVLSDIIDEQNPDFILYDLFHYDEIKNESVRSGNEVLHSWKKYEDLDILKRTMLDLSYCNWSMCNKCISSGLLLDNAWVKNYNTISYGEDTMQSISLYNKAKNFVYTDAHIYNYRIGSGMTRKLPEKYLQDFSRITLFMKKECQTWSKCIEKDIENYYSRIVWMFVKNILQSSSSYNEVKNRIAEVDSYDLKREFSILPAGSIGKKDRMMLPFLKRGWYRVPYIFFSMIK